MLLVLGLGVDLVILFGMNVLFWFLIELGYSGFQPNFLCIEGALNLDDNCFELEYSMLSCLLVVLVGNV